MPDDSSARTSATLLHQLHHNPLDQDAWNRFVSRYAPKIYQWCLHWRLQPADAEDVTQNVLLRVSAKMRTFEYDASRKFRGWLRKVTHDAWRDYVTTRARPGGGMGGEDAQLVLDSVEAREDLTRRLEEEFDRELFEQAVLRVQARVAPHTWEAFRLTAVEGLSGAEVAPRVGMQVAMVYAARSKVQKMLSEEIRRLEEPEAE